MSLVFGSCGVRTHACSVHTRVNARYLECLKQARTRSHERQTVPSGTSLATETLDEQAVRPTDTGRLTIGRRLPTTSVQIRSGREAGLLQRLDITPRPGHFLNQVGRRRTDFDRSCCPNSACGMPPDSLFLPCCLFRLSELRGEPLKIQGQVPIVHAGQYRRRLKWIVQPRKQIPVDE